MSRKITLKGPGKRPPCGTALAAQRRLSPSADARPVNRAGVSRIIPSETGDPIPRGRHRLRFRAC